MDQGDTPDQENPDIVVMKPDDGGGETPVEITGIYVTPSKVTLQIGTSQQFTAMAMLDDGTESDVTDQVQWMSADASIAELSSEVPGYVTAVAEGQVAISASGNDFTSDATVIVAPDAPTLDSITLTGPTDLAPGGGGPLAVEGAYSDGSVVDMTADAVFVSSDPSIVDVTAEGIMTAVGAGSAVITASVESLTADLNVSVTCSYPSNPSTEIREGQVMPNVSWQGAYDSSGNTVDLSLESVMCTQEYSDYSVAIFVIGAGWCPACTSYTQNLAPQAEGIDAAGGLIIYVEAEDASYRPASSQYAYSHVGNLIGNTPGIMVGDGETEPSARMFYNSPMTTQFPTAFVVRLSDMKVIINQNRFNSMLPYAQIALNPDADWSDPSNPPFSNNCGANDDEIYEPNDAPAQAQVIPVGTFQAGICDEEPDFYRIDIPGQWRLSLDFTHAIGDIDVWVWNEAANGPLMNGNQEVGAESGNNDEEFTHSGPSLIRVFGYENASAPYTLTLEEL